MKIKNIRGKALLTLPVANLREANLTSANLREANLREANLTSADLTVADLTGADLTVANFTGANLRGANFTGANLRGANFTGADLTGANLTGADLRGVDLTGANLNLCIGNNIEVKSLQMGKYIITYTKDILAIGCESYTVAQWEAFTDAEIKLLDGQQGLSWWRLNKDIILTLAKRECDD